MKSDIEVGQVLALKVRFNNHGDVARSAHPYLVVDLEEDLEVVEIAQIDSLKGKEWKAFRRSNKVIYSTDPTETVIDKDSYVQLDNTLQVEDFSGLERFRRQKDKLSAVKLADVLRAYRDYHATHEIDEAKNVYMNQQEILELNT